MSVHSRSIAWLCMFLAPSVSIHATDQHDLCLSHTNDKRILGQLLEEALLCRSVDVEVQRLRLAYEHCQAHEAR